MTGPDTRRNHRDALAGVVTAIGGLVLFISARTITPLAGDDDAIGPATFPTALSAILVLAGSALCINGLRVRGGDAGEDLPVPWQRLLAMIGAFAAYCVAFIPLGFLISTTAYLALVSCLVDRQRWRRNLVFAVGFSAVVHLTFTRLLGVELPDGVLTWMR